MKLVYQHLTSHQSSREGARVHLLVLHTTEGSDNPQGTPPADLVLLGRIFDGEEASTHYGVNVNGEIAQYVTDDRKAWAVCNFNSLSLNCEQIGFAAFSKDQWFERVEQLRGAARFLLHGHRHFGVPLVHGAVSGGGVSRDGVVQHGELGISGCGHSDCGPGYPFGYVLTLARLYAAREDQPASRYTRRLERKVRRIERRHGVKG